MNANITVLKDESLSVAGRVIEREYREVKRKASAGERIKIVNADYDELGATWGYDNGEVHTVVSSDAAQEVNIRPDGTEDSEIYVEEDEYVTLEPTDTLRIDGARFRMVDRKAAVGERVLVTVTDKFFTSGATFELHRRAEPLSCGHVNYADGTYGLRYGNYRVLEPVEIAETAPLSAKPAHDQAAELIAKLTTRVGALEKRVTALENPPIAPRLSDVGVKTQEAADEIAKATQKTSVTIAEVTAILAQRAKEARQRKRDDIVKRAKEDVLDLLDIGELQERVLPADNPLYDDFYRVEFVVNTEKRTVVALLRPKYGDLFHLETGTFRVFKGIAKCAPGAVFNVWIGKAIALRRALGLTIPAEYFEALNPTEVRVGDVVTFEYVRSYGTEYRVLSLEDGQNLIITADEDEDMVGEYAFGGDRVAEGAIILDDSREDSAEPRKEVA
ncbi:hypothetical protein [Paenibacillus sp. TC-CSREp1]|uniref:hypothetical protein n=1 Tax=Paenibacillus sp. TC-CSREp1 TaxID=3410089 RepID=UPI003CED2F06